MARDRTPVIDPMGSAMFSNEMPNLAADFKRREKMRRKRLEDALAAMVEPSNRSPEEVGELRARPEKLDGTTSLSRRLDS